MSLEFATVGYDEGDTMQHGMDVTIDEQFNTKLKPRGGHVCDEIGSVTFQPPVNNSMGLYGDMIEAFTQSGGADAEMKFDFDLLMLIVFVMAVFYALYLVFSCNTNFIAIFFELTYALILPFVYIPYTFFVKGCPEFIWKSLGNLVGPVWNQVIAIIASFVMTMGTSAYVWWIGIIVTLFMIGNDWKSVQDEENKEDTTTTGTTTGTTKTNVSSNPISNLISSFMKNIKLPGSI